MPFALLVGSFSFVAMGMLEEASALILLGKTGGGNWQ